MNGDRSPFCNDHSLLLLLHDITHVLNGKNLDYYKLLKSVDGQSINLSTKSKLSEYV